MEDGNLIALLKPETLQAAGETKNPAVKFLIGPMLTAAHDGSFLGKEFDRLGERFG
jgi:hypothetical protein